MDNQQIPKADSQFQKIARKNHRKWKLRLLSKGGQKASSGGSPFKEKPDYNRAKSAPPGFGGSLEESEQLDEVIRKKGGKYCLFSKKTKRNLGCYPTKAGAMKREKQVQYFKHLNEEELKKEIKQILQEEETWWEKYLGLPLKQAQKAGELLKTIPTSNYGGYGRSSVPASLQLLKYLDQSSAKDPTTGKRKKDDDVSTGEDQGLPTYDARKLAKKYNLDVAKHKTLDKNALMQEFGGEEKYIEFLDKMFEENKESLSFWTKEKTIALVKKQAPNFSVEPHIIGGIVIEGTDGKPIGLLDDNGTKYGIGQIDLDSYETIKDQIGVPHYFIWIPHYGVKSACALFSKLMTEKGSVEEAIKAYTGSDEVVVNKLDTINNVVDLFENKRLLVKIRNNSSNVRQLNENFEMNLFGLIRLLGSAGWDALKKYLSGGEDKPEEKQNIISDLFSAANTKDRDKIQQTLSDIKEKNDSQKEQFTNPDIIEDMKLSRKELQKKYGGFEGYIEFIWGLFDKNKDSLRGWRRQDTIDLIKKIAPKYGLEPYIAIGVMTGESGLTPTGVFGQTMNRIGNPQEAIRANSTAYGMGGVTHSTYEKYKNIIGVPHYMLWMPKYGIEASIAVIAGNIKFWKGDLARAMQNYAGTVAGGERKMAAIAKAKETHGNMMAENKKLVIKFGEVLEEGKKKGKEDRCTRIAKSKYDAWPSAYASGAVVKCRQGKIWKNIKEEEELDEKWSEKYKKSIDCKNPKGFSQRAHCQGRKKRD